MTPATPPAHRCAPADPDPATMTVTFRFEPSVIPWNVRARRLLKIAGRQLAMRNVGQTFDADPKPATEASRP